MPGPAGLRTGSADDMATSHVHRVRVLVLALLLQIIVPECGNAGRPAEADAANSLFKPVPVVPVLGIRG